MKSWITRGNVTREVKNLGWLLRHWQSVKEFTFCYQPNGDRDGILTAHCGDTTYVTHFASVSVLWFWLNRPVFKGVSILFFKTDEQKGRKFTIGDDEWKRIQKLEYVPFVVELVKLIP